CETNGGLISYEDMANFKATVDEAVTGTYRGYEVHKPGFWTQGPAMVEALNILEGFDLKSMGHNTPEYLHIVVEAVKLAFADRDQYYGDPRFSKIPEETLLSKDYAAERRKLIDPKQLAPGRRPRATLRPALGTRAGQFVMAMSDPRGDNQDHAMLQVLLHVIDVGLTAQEAVEAPRFHTDHFYTSFGNHEFVPGR